jgi:hypothetical protein
MHGSLLSVGVWLVMALCSFTLVAWLKNRRRSGKGKVTQTTTTDAISKVVNDLNDSHVVPNAEEKEKSDEKQIEMSKENDTNKVEKTATGGEEKLENSVEKKGVEEKQSEEQKTERQPENVLMYTLLCMGAVLCLASWLLDQKRDISYVGFPLFISLMILLFALGGVAAIVCMACLSVEDGERLTNLALLATGVVFLGGLTMLQGCM